MNTLINFILGILFGAGLTISGMTDPENIIEFLDITGTWNASLIFVMVGAISVTTIGYHIIFFRSRPILNKKFLLPAQKSIDRPLLIGAVIFGIGWGLNGLCPGPAIAGLFYLYDNTVYFVISMLIGIIGYQLSKPKT